MGTPAGKSAKLREEVAMICSIALSQQGELVISLWGKL